MIPRLNQGVVGAMLLLGILYSFSLCSSKLQAADITWAVSDAAPDLGDEVTVTVSVRNVTAPGFVNWNQLLRFDKDRLELLRQDAGGLGLFLPDSRSLTAINESGEVRAGGMSLSPINSSGVLGRFLFRCRASGRAQIATAHPSPQQLFGTVLIEPSPSNALDLPGLPAPLILQIGGAAQPQRSLTLAITRTGYRPDLPNRNPQPVSNGAWRFENLDPGADQLVTFVLDAPSGTN